MARELYWARRPMTYVEGVSVELGEVLRLRETPKDEKLIRLGYVQLIEEKNPRLFEHGATGRKFIAEHFRDGFARAYEKTRKRTQAVEVGAMGRGLVDREGDEAMEQIAQAYPLYMEKTTASLR